MCVCVCVRKCVLFLGYVLYTLTRAATNYYDGDCSSVSPRKILQYYTAPIEAKPGALKTLRYTLPRALSSFPKSRRRLDNTVLRFAKCLIQFLRRRLRTKTIVLSSSKEKERCVATLGPHSIMPLAIIPLRLLPLAYYIQQPPLLVLPLRYDNRSC